MCELREVSWSWVLGRRGSERMGTVPIVSAKAAQPARMYVRTVRMMKSHSSAGSSAGYGSWPGGTTRSRSCL